MLKLTFVCMFGQEVYLLPSTTRSPDWWCTVRSRSSNFEWIVSLSVWSVKPSQITANRTDVIQLQNNWCYDECKSPVLVLWYFILKTFIIRRCSTETHSAVSSEIMSLVIQR